MATPETVCLGLNHHSSPIAVRERLSRSLSHLRCSSPGAAWAGVREAALLATCNRWELYARLDGAISEPRAFLAALAAQAHGLTPAELDQHSYFLVGVEAHRHLLRVACGLDSPVLGEAQILGQTAGALRHSREQGLGGPALSAVFETAVAAGKRAHAETAINTHPAGVGAAAIALAQKLSGDLRQRRILVAGLGEMGSLILKALRARQATEVAVINRSYERTALVAAETGYSAWHWQDLGQALGWADVVLVATSAPQPLLSCAWLQDALPGRGGRPLVIVDLAVPRNVEPAAAALPGMSLVDIDDLRQGLNAGRAARQEAIPHVEAIIAEELAALDLRLQELAVRPLIADLRLKADQIREQELARTLRYLGEIDPDTLDHLQHFSRALVNKLLHEPTLRLRQQARCQDSASYLRAARFLFGLEGGDGA